MRSHGRTPQGMTLHVQKDQYNDFFIKFAAHLSMQKLFAKFGLCLVSWKNTATMFFLSTIFFPIRMFFSPNLNRP